MRRERPDDRAGDLGAARERARRVDREHGVELLAVEELLEDGRVPLPRRVHEDVEGVQAVPARGHHRPQPRREGRGEPRHAQAPLGELVRDDEADAPAVADDREPLPGERARVGQRLDGVEQLADVADPHDAGAAQGRVEHVVGRDERERVRGERRGGVAPRRAAARLDGEDRLVAGRASRGRHEAPPLAQRLDVEQDRPRPGIAAQEVEDLAEADVRRVPERDEVREADAPGVRPVEQERPDGVGLRDEPDVARQRRHPREAGVQPEVRRQDAEGAAAQEPDAVPAGREERALLERAAVGAAEGPQAARHHHDGPRAERAELVHEIGDGLRGRAEDRRDRGRGAGSRRPGR